ncbi:MAG: DUF1735 domain-containing protein [Bacteroidales bacterium]|jgi:hypothetical protein|nr:DUF1735 domain-containing protein [Bacteroidales bacterium]
MKYFKKITALTALVAAINACDTDAMFHEELYKKVFCLVGSSDNVYTAVHSFENPVSDGFISIYCGGTNPVDEDITVELEYDDSIIGKYNYRYYDLDSARYAQQLPAEKYELPILTATMKAGQTDPYVTIPLKIYTENISPDSIYFIPLKIKHISGNYEINPDMASVLYRPVVENRYAQTSVSTTYQSRGEKDGKEMVATKPMYPLSATTVRVTVGSETGLTDNTADLTKITKFAVILTVNPDNTVSIAPYGTIEVEALGEPQENRYEVTDFKRFHLYYRYRTLKTPATESTPAVYDAWVTVSETLKRQN